MPQTGMIIAAAAAGLAAGAGVVALLWLIRVRALRQQANGILEEARKEAERTRSEAQLKARDEILKKSEEFERDVRQSREELRAREQQVARREGEFERRVEEIEKRERQLDNLRNELTRKDRRLQEREQELASVLEKEKELLLRITGLTKEEARTLLLEKVEREMERDVAVIVERWLQRASLTARERARSIVAAAIQRCAVEHTADTVVSTIDLPDDNLKGRIIGREGRNIRAFEKATGVDVIVDDTPGVVVVSCFDSIRRETARRAMEELVVDGRIHPARIEEIVDRKKREMDQLIVEAGNQALLEMGVRSMHPKLVNLLGRLRFRTSYGQNVLEHSLEVASLAGHMAGELGLDAHLAKRSGLLHDIGKAVDHEVEGGHAQIGAEILKRYEENQDLLNAVAAHHEDVPPQSILAVLIQAADAI